MNENQPPASTPPNAMPPASTPPVKRRRKRRWLKVLLALVLLLIALVVLLPAILSFGPVKTLVTNQAGRFINGRVEVATWNFGWTSPVKIHGLKVYDLQNTLVAEVDRLEVEAPLHRLARGDLNLGKVLVDANLTRLVVHSDGSTNLNDLIKRDPNAKEETTQPSSGEPAKLPDVTADVELKLRGAVEVLDDQNRPVTTVQLRQGSGGTLKIDNINQPIATDLKFIYTVGNDPIAGTVTLAGTADAIENNQIDLASLAADLKTTAANVNLAAANSLLTMAGVKDVLVGGIIDGELAALVQKGESGHVKGKYTWTDALAQAPGLTEPYKAAKIEAPIDVTRAVGNGVSRIKINASLLAPEAWANITGDLPETGLQRLAKKELPGRAGELVLTVQADPQKATANPLVAKMLPAGVLVTGGDVKSVTTVSLQESAVAIKTNSTAALSGTRDGKAQTIKPVVIAAAATLTNLNDIAAGLKQMVVDITSDFAKINLAGETLADLKGNGNVDLDAARREASQFVDFGEMKLGGQAQFTLTNRLKEQTQDTYNIGFNGTTTNLALSLPGRPPINEPHANIDAASEVQIDTSENAASLLKRVGATTANITAGQAPDKPLLVMKAVLDQIDLDKKSIGSIVIDPLTVTELKTAQQRYGAFVQALREQKIEVQNGSLNARFKGHADMSTQTYAADSVEASLPNLKVFKNGKEILNDTFRLNLHADAKMGEKTTEADIHQLSLRSETLSVNTVDGPLIINLRDGVPSGRGKLTLAVNLPRVQKAAAGFNDAPMKNVTAGNLNGTVTLNGGVDVASSVLFDGKLEGLSIPDADIKTENMAFNLDAKLPADQNSVTVTASAKGSLFDFSASNVQANLADVPAAQRVTAGTIDAALPDVPRLIAIARAFGVELALPYELTRGATTLNANITAPGQLAVTAKVANLALANTAADAVVRQYDFDRNKPISLTAAVNVVGGEAIEKVTINDLKVEAEGQSIFSAAPFVINSPTTDPQPSGQIKIDGSIDRITPLLAFLQNAAEPLPYRGLVSFTQTFSSSKGNINLQGAGAIDDFVMLGDRGKAAFSEKQIRVTNDLTANLASKAASIKLLQVDMASSKAASLVMHGGVTDWEKARKLQDILIDFNAPQGDKVLALILPLMSPEQQETLGSLKMPGQIAAKFYVNGAYPAVNADNQPLTLWNDSVQFVDAKGWLSVAAVDAQEAYGAKIENFLLLMTVRKGRLDTLDLDKKGADRFAKPFDINGGKGDLNSIAVNLGNPQLPVSIGRNQRLLKDVQINKVMAANVGKLAGVLFEETEEASGLVDLTVVECNNVPIADLTSGSKRAKAEFLLSVRDLRLDGVAPQQLAKLLGLGSQGIIGNINNAKLSLDGGIARQDLTLSVLKEVEEEDPRTGRTKIVEKQETIDFVGGVDLVSQRFRGYNINLSQGLVPRTLSKNLKIRDGLKIPMEGKTSDWLPALTNGLTAGAAKGAIEGTIQDEIEKKGGNVLEDLLNKNRKRD